MACVAKVRGAEAKVYGDRAAEAAFIFKEIHAVLWTHLEMGKIEFRFSVHESTELSGTLTFALATSLHPPHTNSCGLYLSPISASHRASPP